MTIMKCQFAGEIKKSEIKDVAGKKLAELSICKKNSKKGEADSWLWLRISLWSPADFQIPKLVKGAFIAGSGDANVRSYVDKEGRERSSFEVSASSFDCEISDGSARQDAPAPAPVPAPSPRPRVDIGGGAGDEPPFARPLIAEVWG